MTNEDEILEPIGVVLTHNSKLGDLIGKNILTKGGLENARLLSVSQDDAKNETLENTMHRINGHINDVDSQYVIVIFVESNYGFGGDSRVRCDLFEKMLEKFPNCKTIIGFSSTAGSLDEASNYFKEQFPHIRYVNQPKGMLQSCVVDAIQAAVYATRMPRLNISI